MSDAALKLMVRAGWTEGRRQPIDSELAALEASGYPLWGQLTRFLEEASGLEVRFSDGTQSVWIDARRAVGYSDDDWRREYELLAGTDLVPVGGYSHMLIYFGRTGKLYGSYDAEFGPLADSLEALIDDLLISAPRPLDWRVPD